MSRYTQLSLEERCSIARLHEDGQSIRQIAATLDRQPSTVARELKRNTGRKIGYQPAYAQSLTAARRWTGNKLERDDALRLTVLTRLTAGWSPEQIAGRLAREAGHKVISHETIYRFVYAQIKRTNDTKWRLYLPRAKIKRGWRTKGGWPRNDGKCSIHDRPAHIAERKTPGHWEADCMLFSKPGPAILIAHERHSRFTIALPQPNLKADPVAQSLVQMLKPFAPNLRQSVTFDNGTEFYRHQQLSTLLNIQTYFCDPHAPWQKGSVENAIGRLRRALPRKTDIANLTTDRFNAIIANYNNTPRKCLGFQTPAEAFIQPLHFKCESTPVSSTGRRGEIGNFSSGLPNTPNSPPQCQPDLSARIELKSHAKTPSRKGCAALSCQGTACPSSSTMVPLGAVWMPGTGCCARHHASIKPRCQRPKTPP